jgi:hypothetical protein
MSFYDIFYKNMHSPFFEKILVRMNKNVIKSIAEEFSEKKEISLLEVGPGKGYLYKAVKQSNRKINYFALDRNKLILKSLDTKNTFVSVVPEMPDFKRKFDVIYAAYVIEHLKSGQEVYEFIRNAKKYLNTNGLIVLFAPDAIKQKMEFWNIDYTHIYPTTKRNITMALYENEITNIRIYNINGLLTHKLFKNNLIYFLLRFFLLFYNYKFFHFFSFSNKYDLYDIFYKVYCFVKEENLMVIAKIK